jgi:hypothetical protein
MPVCKNCGNAITYHQHNNYGWRHEEGLEPPMTRNMEICGKAEPIMSSSQGENDVANYRKMQEPLQPEYADEALQKFFEVVKSARKEFHIMDVHIIVMMNILNEETEGYAMSSAHFGNTLTGADMLVFGLIQNQEQLETDI